MILNWLKKRVQLGTQTKVKKGPGVTRTWSRPVIKFSLFGPRAPKPRPRSTRPLPPTGALPAVTGYCPNCARAVGEVGDRWCARCCADQTQPGLAAVSVPPRNPPNRRFAPPHTRRAAVQAAVQRYQHRKPVAVKAHTRNGQRVDAHARSKPVR